MVVAFLAKGLADFTFGGAFLWYLAKYIVSILVAVGAIFLGIKLRRRKMEKNAEGEMKAEE